ncbi:MAG TPA: 4-hydroxy-3-methylbut-2-en-1-yl diphosphate synthase, partial [Prochlorococcaceae cyanobacterium Fu_MAG_72]|nr:4-hydroxy-3-methylbut-2-en-1-yl diphosphate synthase [Prochlorococcaceae cyanobacterium Fu_MAG_72]
MIETMAVSPSSASQRYETQIKRRLTRTVMVGGVAIGSEHPVRVQSMINEDTLDVEGAAAG